MDKFCRLIIRPGIEAAPRTPGEEGGMGVPGEEYSGKPGDAKGGQKMRAAGRQAFFEKPRFSLLRVIFYFKSPVLTNP